MPKQPKQKQPKLSKEQVAAHMAAVTEAKRLRGVARESIFPALLGARSLVHAQQICEILKTVITAAQNKYWSDKTIKDLGLLAEMSQEEEVLDKEIYTALLQNLGDTSIADAHKLIEGMGGALNGYTAKIARETLMSSLTAEDIIEA